MEEQERKIDPVLLLEGHAFNDDSDQFQEQCEKIRQAAKDEIILHEDELPLLAQSLDADVDDVESAEQAKIILQNTMRMLDEPVVNNPGFWSSIWTHGWKPTNNDLLRDAEARMLQLGLKTAKYDQFFVDCKGQHINTIKMGSGPPLVMIHGFGGGVACWVANLEEISQHYTIYAFDILGFGRSSHPCYTGKTPEHAENWFLEVLEEWSSSLQLDKFYLMGHSFGAFLAAIYSLKNPSHIIRLILADPWGVPKNPTSQRPPTWKMAAVRTAMSFVSSPFILLRALGPYGPSIIEKVRPDLLRKFSHIFPDPSIFANYLYHCNVQNPSGEDAFHQMQIPFGWAKLPLENRLGSIGKNVPISVIYGAHTWMGYDVTFSMLKDMPCPMDIAILPNAGHHVYIDAWKLFNEAVILAKDGRLREMEDKIVRFGSNY